MTFALRHPGDDEGFSRHDPDGGPGFKKHEGENYIVYTGMETGEWPQTGKLHFRLDGKGCDLVQDVDINATVTFDSVPVGGATGAVSRTVEVEYTFSESHSGFYGQIPNPADRGSRLRDPEKGGSHSLQWDRSALAAS